VGHIRSARIDWLGEGVKFRGRGTDPETPAVEIDGDGETGPSPTLSLLMAAAGCTGADVVVILAKMRVQLSALSIEVTGERRAEDPKRFTSVRLRYLLSGENLDRAKVDRAIALSLDKYCSVVHSLAPDIDLDYDIEIA
jgi:putative redox protein